MIIILSTPQDVHAQHVANILQQQGKTVYFYDYYQYPQESTLSLVYSKNGITGNLRDKSGHEISLSEVSAFYYRRPGSATFKNAQSKKLKRYIEREASTMIASLPYITPQAFWLSHPDALRNAERKAYQLVIASECGFNIPATCIGNSPVQAVSFAQNKHLLALKALQHPSFFPELSLFEKLKRTLFYFREGKGFQLSDPPDQWYQPYLSIMTKQYSSEEIIQMSESFQNCPVILQEYVAKLVELRITVVGKQVIACAIHSQKNKDATVDWRAAGDLDYEPYSLPFSVEEQCRNLIRKLGLQFGCIDMIVTPDHEYVFLEVNPNGQWLWVEEKTGLPIGQAVAALLMDPEAHRVQAS